MPAKKRAQPSAKKVRNPGTSRDAARARKNLFANAFIANGGNATEAAKSAGYSPATAYSQGHRLLKDAEVQRQVSSATEKIAKKYELNAEMVVKSIVQEITFDPAKLYREDGSLKDITELDEDTRASLAGVEFATEGSAKDGFTFVRKLKWAPKQGAREQAMKHLGMFSADNTQKSPLAGLEPNLLETARDHLSALIKAQKAKSA